MANFFQSPQIQQTPNPEPPGYNLIRQMMLQRLMQQFTNPYGMSPGGMANWQGFNQGSKPFDPTGGFSSQGGSPGYNYLTNQGMPGMGGPGGGTYQSGSQSLGNGPRTMSGGGSGNVPYPSGPPSSGVQQVGSMMGNAPPPPSGMSTMGGPSGMGSGAQGIGGISPAGSGGNVAGLLQALLGGGTRQIGTSIQSGSAGTSPSMGRWTMPYTAGYDGSVVSTPGPGSISTSPGAGIGPVSTNPPMQTTTPGPVSRPGVSTGGPLGGVQTSGPGTYASQYGFGHRTMPYRHGYDGNVMGYGGNSQPSALMGYGGTMFGAPMSHSAMPHLLGLLRMAHTQPRGSMGPRPANGMAMPMPMGRRR